MGYVSSCCSAIFVSSAAQRYHLIICKGAKVKFRVNKHFSFFSILCLYKAFQEMGRRPCSEVAFSQWAFLSGEWARLRGSPPHQVDFPPLCMCGMFYTLPGFKKKNLPGQCPFLWHGADSRNSMWGRHWDLLLKGIFMHWDLSCWEDMDSLDRSTGPNCAFIFLATHLIFLYWIKYQARYHSGKGMHLRSERRCLAGFCLYRSVFKGGCISLEKGLL